MTIKRIQEIITSSIKTKQALVQDYELMDQINDVASYCIRAIKEGGKVIFCGNGGSFADAQHLSAEFTSRFLFDRPGLASIALGTNSSSITAIGNDYGYDKVFSREIEAIASKRDVLIALTTSGNSSNILMACEAAKLKQICTVVLTGSSRGMLEASIKVLQVPSSETARIQECHILIGHIICGLVEESIFGNLRVENA